MPTDRFRIPAGLAMVATVVLVSGAAASAAQAPVGLGTAAQFGVLAGSGITNTGATTITGDVGSFPTPSETGFGSVTLIGTDQAGDSVTQQAKTDLVTAYNDAAGRTPVTNVPVELGGTTLVAGVYTSPTFGLTGTLTLDAQNNPNAEFIFQAGSTLITASNSQVLLLNGASACNVVWQVGSSATFNTGTRFVGDVLAETSVTADTGATFQGRLLAQNGAVTLDHNTITNAGCAAPAVAPTTTTSTTSTTSTSTTSTSTTSTSTTSTSTTSTSTSTTTTTLPVATTTTVAGPGGGSTPGPTSAVPVVIPAGPNAAGTAGTPAATGSATPTPPSGGPVPLTGATPNTGGVTPTPVPGLPFTGAPLGDLAAAGLVLIALGALSLKLGRRRS